MKALITNILPKTIFKRIMKLIILSTSIQIFLIIKINIIKKILKIKIKKIEVMISLKLIIKAHLIFNKLIRMYKNQIV
jgi:hypothetical protein